MKPGIHPDYHEVTVHCACGSAFKTRSTHQGRAGARGNLLELPPLFHRQAEVARYRRPRGALHPQIREGRRSGASRQKPKARSSCVGCSAARRGVESVRKHGHAFIVCFAWRYSPEPRRLNPGPLRLRPSRLRRPASRLRNSFAHPYDSAIAAARTCYAPRLIVRRGNHRQAAHDHRRGHVFRRPSHRLPARAL